MRTGFRPEAFPSYRRMMVFIDGENLAINFKKYLKEGMLQKEDVQYEENIYIWHQDSIKKYDGHEIIRAY